MKKNVIAKGAILMLTAAMGLNLTSCSSGNVNSINTLEAVVESSVESKAEPYTETKKLFTSINRYVLNPADKHYLTDIKMESYKKALDAVINHKGKVKLTDSYDDNLDIMGYLQENPYTFVLESFDLTDDHQSMTFKYKYSKDKCKEMMDYIDNEYVNYSAIE